MTNPQHATVATTTADPASDSTAPEPASRRRTPRELISIILARREDRAFAGQMAAIRSGLTPATELYAFGYTEPYLVGLPPAAALGARRAAAITATARGTRQAQTEPYPRIGESLRGLYAAENHGRDPVTHVSTITQQVNSLPLLDVEAAATVLSLLVQRCGPARVPVDFYDLLTTLQRWGNGIDTLSRDTRAKVVSRFYDA